jgi:hypothetical protein
MLDRYVGWVRSGWTYWEPVATGDDLETLWEHLRGLKKDDVDGELLVLPSDERPIVGAFSSGDSM